MLKTIGSLDMTKSEIENGNGEVIKQGADSNNKEPTKRSRKLFKSQKLFQPEKSKGEKLAKS